MSRYDFNAQRLFVEAELAEGRSLACTPAQANYLRNVLRLKAGAAILVFNGRDGEWRAELAEADRRATALIVRAQTRAQEGGPDIDYLFAPLKRARLDYMVEKATEMGVARLRPVLTRRTVAERVNAERMRAHAIEAAEQCGILRLPEIRAPEKLEAVVAAWNTARPLIFCDEDGAETCPFTALAMIEPGPVAVLVGPEGGFDPAERELLASRPFVTRISLGPRILRADTAAVAALALVNAVLGDWR
ncbi:MAG TPA: 16S rRNA (uracil(1498)-N(3))-methyltransferase [Hyphomicrobiaceae bacterium]|jgi:16S rRNA (uracil1498-N3)-methyltransferase|nr:16S rRNA (uracil(1498)-N(3))-methyltransferase [Hyphomicrobiaceae bacterium]